MKGDIEKVKYKLEFETDNKDEFMEICKVIDKYAKKK